MEETELEECTFSPKFVAKKSRIVNENDPAGFKENIERLRLGHSQRVQQKEALEKVSRGENYFRMRNLGISEFNFACKPRDHKEVLVHVDVDLGQGKTGRINLHKDDNPRELAKNFCKTFGISDDRRRELEKGLRIQQDNYATNDS